MSDDLRLDPSADGAQMAAEDRDAAARKASREGIDRHMLLEAGAGSGKTRSLVDRYCYLLDHDPGATVDNIAAVTFTRKAAREMKQRVRRELADALARTDDPARRRALREQIRGLETAPIATIHSLCSSILLQFPFAAGVDPRFGLLDEMQSSVQLPRVVEDSLLAGLEEGRASAAEVIGRLGGLRQARETLESVAASRSQYREWLAHVRDAGQLVAGWEQAEAEWLDGRVRALEADGLWAQVLAGRERAAGAARLCKEGDALAPKLIRVAALPLDPLPTAAPALARLVAEVAEVTKNANRGAQKNWPSKEDLEHARSVLRALKGAVEEHLGALTRVAEQPGEDTARLAAAIWEEARRALDAWAAFKRTVPALDFDDVQLVLRDLLVGDEATRRAVGARFRHLLVDEFQDTDELQKELIWLLAGLADAEAATSRVFVVGDAKQSIYRFRSADVTVFNATRAEFRDGSTGPTGGDGGREVRRLELSYRPNRDLMAFFNDLFPRAAMLGPDAAAAGDGAPRAEYETGYAAMQAARPGQAPLSPAAFGLLALGAPGEDVNLCRVAEAEAIARLIRQLLDAGLAIYDHTIQAPADAPDPEARWRPLGPGDIAILFRAASQVHLYEDALADAGVPFYNAAGRGFYTRAEIMDMLDALRAVDNPADEIALVALLRSPMFSISDATLYWLAQEPVTWWNRIQRAGEILAGRDEARGRRWAEEGERLTLAAESLSRWRDLRHRVPVAALLDEILEATGYSAAVAALPGGERCVANLHKLLDQARAFEASQGGGLSDFVDWLSSLADQDTKEAQAPTEEEEGDSVRLSTVHGAKGLQWPVVIVADMARQPRAGFGPSRLRMHPRYGLIPAEVSAYPTSQWRLAAEILKDRDDSEEDAEERRLLYVALTRASDVVVMSAAWKVKETKDGVVLGKAPSGSWLGRLAEAMGLDTEKTPVPAAPGRLQAEADLLCPWFVVPRTDDGAGGEEGPLVPLQVRRRAAAPAGAEAATREPPPAVPEADVPTTPEPPSAPSPAGSGSLAVALRAVPPDAAARTRFTVTELARYRECPRYYWLRYVEGLPDRPSRAARLASAGRSLTALEMGNLAHHLLRMVGTGGAAALDELLSPILPGGQALRMLTEGELAALREMVEWYLRDDFYLHNIAGADVLRTEAPISFLLRDSFRLRDSSRPGPAPAPGKDVLIEGKVDAVAETAGAGLVLLDYKTGRKTGRPEERPDDEGPVGADRFQLALYALGLRSLAEEAAGRAGVPGGSSGREGGPSAKPQQPMLAAVVYLRDKVIDLVPIEVESAEAEAGARGIISRIKHGAASFPPSSQRDRCDRCGLRWACDGPPGPA